MTNTTTCAKCGFVMVAAAVAGQCPRCLLGMASGAYDDLGMTDPDFSRARRQFGDYVLGRQVGAGGMGIVYEAQRLSDGGKVAIKLIRESHVASATQLRRFTLEAEAAARLDHPHIVRIHEIADGDGHPFFSMDFIEGECLSAKTAKGDFASMPADQQIQAARLMSKVARAVHHAHVRGVLHRDLKPGNILIDRQGEPHLTDFGLAKILQREVDDAGPRTLTTSGDVSGTPSYMSPEQVSGANIGCASDIYGLGAVLYALLTGRPPFQGPTTLDVFKQIVDYPPARPRLMHPSLHVDLETICLKCLEKDPRHRYGTAEVLAEDLDNFAEGRSIKARRASLTHRTQQWIKRNPIGSALTGSLSLGLAVALVLLKIVNDQRHEIELDRDLTFDEGMQKISEIWRDPSTKSVTISARELAILAGRSPPNVAGARHQLSLGVSADAGPSSMAQRYARLLGSLQEQMGRELGEKVAFNLRLLKRFNQGEETLVRGEVDFLVLSAVDFLQAERTTPGVTVIAHANVSHQAVIFTGTNSGLDRLSQLRGKSMAFPDPDLSLTVWAKARLFEAGVCAKNLRFCSNIIDQGTETGQSIISIAATIDRVLRGDVDAGVTHRSHFERYRHLGLVALDYFPETPNVLAAREGVEPQLIGALRKAIRSVEGHASWPDSKFVVEPRVEKGSPATSLLGGLRDAMKQAKRFEQLDGL